MLRKYSEKKHCKIPVSKLEILYFKAEIKSDTNFVKSIEVKGNFYETNIICSTGSTPTFINFEC